MDNMFIIVEALESVDPDIQGEERLVIAMKHIGGSITMTTSTDLVAFAISTVSDFPAVHMFCVYAALSIVFAYLMLITLFLAILTWDIHRIEKGKPDICACRKPIEEARGQNPWLKEKEDISKRVSCTDTFLLKKSQDLYHISTRSESRYINLFTNFDPQDIPFDTCNPQDSPLLPVTRKTKSLLPVTRKTVWLEDSFCCNSETNKNLTF